MSLDGLSLQYRSSSGSPGGSPFALDGEVPAGGHYLVKANDGSDTSQPALPTPDATSTFSMSGSNGQVLLVDGTDAYAGSGDLAGAAGLVDMVGYGSATSYETAAAAGLSNSISASRAGSAADTDDNAADFSAGSPTPTNSGGDEPDPDPEPTDATIEQIQGSGDATPLDGELVRTRGLVTAAYPDGGFYGFYLQTPGTGGTLDLGSHDTSNALFVYMAYESGGVTVAPGDLVEVTGEADEYAGLTQVRVSAAEDVVTLDEPADPVVPVESEWPDSDAEKESLEGMVFSAASVGDFTVTDTYNINSFGEVQLAQGDTPLRQPTDVALPGSAEADAVAADNAARGIVLDDGSSTRFNASSFSGSTCGTRPVPCLLNGDLTPPYVSNDDPVRVGAAATFTDDVVLSQGGSPSSPTYRFQPLSTVVGPANTASPAAFEDTRTDAPADGRVDPAGTADLRVASFNVLNYFTTLADADDDGSADGSCEGYYDRDDDGNNVRGGCDIRGAWDPLDLQRQQEKIVAAINALDADVVGLMEIENSAALGETADEATQSLVDALNADLGATHWAANPSSADLPPAGEQDVITNALIYRTDAVERTGPARALGDQSGDDQAFGNAREPIAQAFTPVGGDEPLLVVVNHFKSKGSVGPWPGDEDQGDGQGTSNESRVRQATALAGWVPGVQEDLGTDQAILLGDFNAYGMEDPMRVLYDAGYTDAEQHAGLDSSSYVFGGQVGSLDHVLLNDAALETMTGADIWNINSGESVALEYSRYNNHATDFHRADPYRSSDHDPVVVGLDVVEPAAAEVSASAETARYGEPIEVQVDVTGERGPATGGTVVVSKGPRTLGEADVVDGSAVVEIEGGKLWPGRKTLDVSYSGDGVTGPGETTVQVRVRKAASSLRVTHRPGRVVAGKTRARLMVRHSTDPSVAVGTGWVRITVPGQGTRVRRLEDSETTLRLGRFSRPGTKRVFVKYNGNRRAGKVWERHDIDVVG